MGWCFEPRGLEMPVSMQMYAHILALPKGQPYLPTADIQLHQLNTKPILDKWLLAILLPMHLPTSSSHMLFMLVIAVASHNLAVGGLDKHEH